MFGVLFLTTPKNILWEYKLHEKLIMKKEKKKKKEAFSLVSDIDVEKT